MEERIAVNWLLKYDCENFEMSLLRDAGLHRKISSQRKKNPIEYKSKQKWIHLLG